MTLNEQKLDVINQTIKRFNELFQNSKDILNQSYIKGRGICEFLLEYHKVDDVREIDKIYHIPFYYLIAKENYPNTFLTDNRYWFERSADMIPARLTMLQFMRQDIIQERPLDDWFNSLSFQDKYRVIQVDYFDSGDETNQSPEDEKEITNLFLDEWIKTPIPVKQDEHATFLNPKHIRRYKWDYDIIIPNAAGHMTKTGGWIKLY